MNTIYFLLSIIIIALILYSVMTKDLPKRKAIKLQRDKPAQREISECELALLKSRERYEQMLERLSDSYYYKPYPEYPELTYFDSEKFDRTMLERSSIQQCIRDINSELMRLKEYDHE